MEKLMVNKKEKKKERLLVEKREHPLVGMMGSL
jgi:hypothetical protein